MEVTLSGLNAKIWILIHKLVQHVYKDCIWTKYITKFELPILLFMGWYTSVWLEDNNSFAILISIPNEAYYTQLTLQTFGVPMTRQALA